MYRFGPFRFDGTRRRLYRYEEPMALTPKAAETLLALLERVDRIVEKDELLRIVWGDVFVGEDTLAQNISTLRRVLGDDVATRSSSPRYRGEATGSWLPSTTHCRTKRIEASAKPASESA
jgi:DNA-binding winged helix-turn-helix (wHTH) protein